MTEDVEDIKFEKLLADKRHKELKNTLNVIANSLSEKKDDGIKEALDKQEDAIKSFVQVIRELPKPEVNVEVNQDKVIISVEQLLDSNERILKAFEDRPIADSFDIVRGYGGLIEKVKVNYKTFKEIRNKQLK